MSVEANYSTINPLTTLENLSATLDELGVAVLPNVFTESECNDVMQKMYDYLAYEFQVVTPDDYRKLLPVDGFILKSFGIALRPEILEIKTDERVVDAFRHIWKEQDLTTSFDAITIDGPPEQKTKKTFFDVGKTWFHTDQSSQKKGKHCVQSFINLEEASEGDGCLSVLVNSHKYHEEFFNHFQEESYGDWFLLNKTTHRDWYTKEKGCKWGMVAAPKGSMVFWDSRTIHMGATPRMGRANPDRWRFIAYVCYTPARLQTQRDALRKKDAYISGSTTTHWPYGVSVESNQDRVRRRNDLSELSPRQRKLFFGIE